MGAAYNALMEEETKESLAKMCCELMDEVAALKASHEFLNETFLQLMNDIGRIGHERFGADAIEVAGGKRKIERHQKNAILVHVAEHLVDYKLGIPHDKLGTLQAHLGAAAFNCMLEFVFSKGEE